MSHFLIIKLLMAFVLFMKIDNRLKLKNTKKSKGDDNEDSPPINA